MVIYSEYLVAAKSDQWMIIISGQASVPYYGFFAYCTQLWAVKMPNYGK
jgi:hypothetical protein